MSFLLVPVVSVSNGVERTVVPVVHRVFIVGEAAAGSESVAVAVDTRFGREAIQGAGDES